jgi:hypothetical protein
MTADAALPMTASWKTFMLTRCYGVAKDQMSVVGARARSRKHKRVNNLESVDCGWKVRRRDRALLWEVFEATGSDAKNNCVARRMRKALAGSSNTTIAPHVKENAKRETV